MIQVVMYVIWCHLRVKQVPLEHTPQWFPDFILMCPRSPQRLPQLLRISQQFIPFPTSSAQWFLFITVLQVLRMPPLQVLQVRASTPTTTGLNSSLSEIQAHELIQKQPLILNYLLGEVWQGLGLESQMEFMQGYFLLRLMPQFYKWKQTSFGDLCSLHFSQQSITSCSDKLTQSRLSSSGMPSALYFRQICLLTSNQRRETTEKIWLPSQSFMFFTGGMYSVQLQQYFFQNSAISRQSFCLATEVTMKQSSRNSCSVRSANSLTPWQQLWLSCLLLKIASCV